MKRILKTETQEYFKADKKEKRKLKKLKTLNVKYKGYNFDLNGFKVLKENKKVVFAYKIKLLDIQTGIFIYYNPENNYYLNKLIREKEQEGFIVINLINEFDKALSQKNILKKWT